jgi:hypothetical protein
MKQALQYQQSIQHMLNVAKKQSTVVRTPKAKPVEPTPPPVIVETKSIIIPESKVEVTSNIEETENTEFKLKKH